MELKIRRIVGYYDSILPYNIVTIGTKEIAYLKIEYWKYCGNDCYDRVIEHYIALIDWERVEIERIEMIGKYDANCDGCWED